MKQFESDLLKRIIAPAVGEKDLPFDVSHLEKIIKEKIPATLEKNAPPNFPELYFDFEYVYSKFYDFLLFNQLIGKKIVALGGGFSSGKSTFLNSFLGEMKILPTAINPSTSVPTYVISGDREVAGAVNVFSAKIAMEIAEVRAVAHGFGEDENPSDGVTLGHLLRSIFVATPGQPYANIAFLDTPGYSKPDSENYSAKTDEKIARSQLNAGDYILWFISAESGTIGSDDLNFLASLDKSIPKLIILNKTDKVAGAENLSAMRQKVKAALDGKGITYEDILNYSCSHRKNVARDSSKIAEIFSRLNARRGESD
ncbi:MAG: dynamin family protein, partial [Selenomonadaceae bacterium]|nr:dynamin family protein [Selenomonadaceae bacterium]